MAVLVRFFSLSCFGWFVALFVLTGCQQLDDDGGFYDEKSNRYVYVKPKHISPKDYKAVVRQPRPGEPQTIKAKVVQIDPDLKSLWIFFEERQSYQLLAQTMSKGNRDDKNKRLRIHLKFVSPLGSVEKPSFRKQWADYVEKRLSAQLLGHDILAEIHYLGKAKQLNAYVSQSVKNAQGKEAIRNVNQWMIYEGLTYFLLQDAEPDEILSYNQAQSLAKDRLAGLWKYQR